MILYISTLDQLATAALLPEEPGERQLQHINFEGANVVTHEMWNNRHAEKGGSDSYAKDPDLQEGRIVIRNGQLLVGTMDNKQLGAQSYSLVHAMHELHGSATAALMLGSLSRLMGRMLRTFAFTCGIADMCLKPEADARRKQLLEAGNQSIIDTDAEPDRIVELSKQSTEACACVAACLCGG